MQQKKKKDCNYKHAAGHKGTTTWGQHQGSFVCAGAAACQRVDGRRLKQTGELGVRLGRGWAWDGTDAACAVVERGATSWCFVAQLPVWRKKKWEHPTGGGEGPDLEGLGGTGPGRAGAAGDQGRHHPAAAAPAGRQGTQGLRAAANVDWVSERSTGNRPWKHGSVEAWKPRRESVSIGKPGMAIINRPSIRRRAVVWTVRTLQSLTPRAGPSTFARFVFRMGVADQVQRTDIVQCLHFLEEHLDGLQPCSGTSVDSFPN